MIEELTHFPKIFQGKSLRIIVPVPVTDLKDKGRNDTLHVHQTESVTATAMDQRNCKSVFFNSRLFLLLL